MPPFTPPNANASFLSSSALLCSGQVDGAGIVLCLESRSCDALDRACQRLKGMLPQVACRSEGCTVFRAVVPAVPAVPAAPGTCVLLAVDAHLAGWRVLPALPTSSLELPQRTRFCLPTPSSAPPSLPCPRARSSANTWTQAPSTRPRPAAAPQTAAQPRTAARQTAAAWCSRAAASRDLASCGRPACRPTCLLCLLAPLPCYPPQHRDAFLPPYVCVPTACVPSPSPCAAVPLCPPTALPSSFPRRHPTNFADSVCAVRQTSTASSAPASPPVVNSNLRALPATQALHTLAGTRQAGQHACGIAWSDPRQHL